MGQTNPFHWIFKEQIYSTELAFLIMKKIFSLSLFVVLSMCTRSQSIDAIKSKYDLVTEYTYDGFALVCNQNLWGAVNELGEEIVPVKYDCILKFDINNCAVVSSKGKYGTVNKKGEVKIPIEYDYVSSFVSSNGTYTAVKNGKWGMIDAQNKVLVPFTFFAGSFNSNGDGLFNGISSNLTFIRFLPNGEEIKIPNVKSLDIIAKGFYKVVTNDNKIGVINNEQEFVIPLGSRKIMPLISNVGLVEIREEGGLGVYSLVKGNWLIKPECESIYSLCNERVIEVEVNSENDDEESVLKFFDVNGTQLFGKSFQDSEEPDGGGEKLGFLKLQFNDKWGLYHYNGREILPFEMYSEDEIKVLNSKYIIAKRTTGWGIMDIAGNQIIPFKYFIGNGKNPFRFYNPDGEEYYKCWTYINDESEFGAIDKNGLVAIPFQFEEEELNVEEDKYNKQTYAVFLINGNLKIQNITTKEILFDRKVDNRYINDITLQLSFNEAGDRSDRGCYFEGIKTGAYSGVFLLNKKKYYSSTVFNYESYLMTHETFVVTNNQKQFALADLNGKLLTGFDYELIEDRQMNGDVDNGLYFTVNNNRAGFIDGRGNTVVPFECDVIRDAFGNIANKATFFNGYCYELRIGGKKVLYNSNGELIDTRSFDLPETAEYRYTDFWKKDYLMGYTSTRVRFMYNGELVESGANFQNNSGILMYKDPVIQSPDFSFPSGVVPLMKDGKYAYFTYNGTQLTPFEFDKASEITALGYAYVQKGNEYFLIDNKGVRLPFTDLYLEVYKQRNK